MMKCALILASLFEAAAFQGPSSRRATALTRRPSSPSPIADNIWSTPSVRVQGETLKTWVVEEIPTQRVQVSIRSSGRPVECNVEYWHTPSYTPTHFKCYSEDGLTRPIHAIVETPKHPKTIALRNTGPMVFPFQAQVKHTGLESAYACFSALKLKPESIQGGKTVYFPLDGEVDSVQVLLKTPDRNMKAKIEITVGPNQVKQTFELYASSGYKNPFYAIIQTPGEGCTLRLINENSVEFPFDAWVLPYQTSPSLL